MLRFHRVSTRSLYHESAADHSRISAPTSLQSRSAAVTSGSVGTGSVQRTGVLLVWRHRALLKIKLIFTVINQKAGNVNFISALAQRVLNCYYSLPWKMPWLQSYKALSLAPILPLQTAPEYSMQRTSCVVKNSSKRKGLPPSGRDTLSEMRSMSMP